MKKTSYSYILILTTLLIGFGAGWLANGYFLKQKVTRFKQLVEGKQSLADRMIEELNLEEEKVAIVRPILDQRLDSVRSLQREFRVDMRQEMVGLLRDLRPHLTEEQLQIVRTMMRPLGRKGRPGGPPRHGPPPPRP